MIGFAFALYAFGQLTLTFKLTFIQITYRETTFDLLYLQLANICCILYIYIFKLYRPVQLVPKYIKLKDIWSAQVHLLNFTLHFVTQRLQL